MPAGKTKITYTSPLCSSCYTHTLSTCRGCGEYTCGNCIGLPRHLVTHGQPAVQ